MTLQQDCSTHPLFPPQSTSSEFAPPSLASAIRPQLLIHRQEDQHVRSVSNPHLTILIDHPQINPPRKGFDSTDFKTDSNSNPSSSAQQTSSYSSSPSSHHQNSLTSIRQRIYHIIDSLRVTLLIFVLMAIDYCFFLTSYLYTLHHQSSSLFSDLYRILDWLTVVTYLLEVNFRLYTYGPNFYFHGALRCLDYVIASANAIFIVTFSIYHLPWLLVIRFIRTLRMVTALTTWRERKLKGRTRHQLQCLADMLEKEKSDHSKLTKWKIDPEAIAIGERAGRGGFGTVFSGLFRGTLVAVKQVSYPDHKQAVTSIEDEAITLVNLRHPNVVLFMGFVHEPSQLWIVTEYCSRGSLRDLLDDTSVKLTEGRILKLALGAARGLAYLHGQNPPVLHLDLKTSNILISSGWDAKLGDFGLSRSIDKIEKGWFSGTMQYAAPEILQANVFSTAADIYSFGICLWELAARDVPFQGLSPMAVLWGVVKSKLRPSLEGINIANSRPNEEIKNDSLSNEIQIVSKAVSEGKSRSSPSRFHEASEPVLRHDGKDLLEPAFATCKVSKEHCTTSGRSFCVSPRQNDSHELQNHDKFIERVEEIDKTGAIVKEPVTASIVEGIVLPSSLKLRDRTSFQGTQNGQDEEESGSPSQPKKKRSALRDHKQLSKTEHHNSHLTGLTHKVTQTIQMFDERPPVIRRKEEEGSSDNGIQSKPESMTGSASGGQSIRTKRSIIERSSLRFPRQFSKLKQSNKVQDSCSRKELGAKRDEDDPFMRRLASVSNCAKLTDTSALNDGLQQGGESSTVKAKSKEGVNSGGVVPYTIPQAVVPKEYVELIQKCWSHDPKDRPSAGEIVWRLVILIDSQMREK